MLKGVNDSVADAKELVRLLAKIPAKINLIPFNPWPGAPFECSDWEQIEKFAEVVNRAGYASPVRSPRGRDIMAACGQLKSASVKTARRVNALASRGLTRLAVILRTIFRMAWVVVAFFVAALAALAVLFALGAIWVGDELRAAAPDDPLVRDGAPIFGMVLFAGTVGPALDGAAGADRRGGRRSAEGPVVDVLRAGGRGVACRHSDPGGAGGGRASGRRLPVTP